MRAALKALLDSSWADSAAGKRRERQIYFYRDSADHSPIPTVIVDTQVINTKPPTPCEAWVQRINRGPEYVLMGFAHSHPFTQGETKPIECGPNHYNTPYQPKPSTYDKKAQAALKVPGYAIDKNVVNKFRRKSFWSTENKYYTWNSASCRW